MGSPASDSPDGNAVARQMPGVASDPNQTVASLHSPSRLMSSYSTASNCRRARSASSAVYSGASRSIVTWGGSNDVYSGATGGTSIANMGYAEQSAIDPGVDDALLEFIAKRKASFPDSEV